MADFLTFGGLTLKTTAWRRLEDETGGGNQTTLSGQVRGTPLWVAGRWDAEVHAETAAEAAAIRALCDGRTTHAASGNALPYALALSARITNEDTVRDRAGHYYVLSIAFRGLL